MKNILSVAFVCACKFEAAIQRQNSTTSEMSTTNSKHHYNLALGQGHKVLKTDTQVLKIGTHELIKLHGSYHFAQTERCYS